jgi:hypothetical protein
LRGARDATSVAPRRGIEESRPVIRVGFFSFIADLWG